jgi:hypothetical protein
MARLVWFVLGTVGMLAAMLFVAWAANGFVLPAMHGHQLIAFILGSVLAAALAIGLMALVFHSHRSGHDESGG